MEPGQAPGLWRQHLGPIGHNGLPVRVSPVEPGSSYDITAAHAMRCPLTALTGQALEGWLLTVEETDPRQSNVLDGTLPPCWTWKNHSGLYSGKHRRTGLSLPVLAALDGGLVWAADPLPGSVHDVRALDVSGLLEALEPVTIVADIGYIGCGLTVPPIRFLTLGALDKAENTCATST